MTRHGKMTVSTAEGVLAGTLAAAAAGFAVGRFHSPHMDPALIALQKYADAADPIVQAGIQLSQEEQTQDRKRLEDLLGLYMTNFQTKAEDRNQAKYQEKIATQLKAMMDGLKPLKKRKAGAVEGTYSKGDANEGKTVGGDGAGGSSEMDADDVAGAKAWLCWRFFLK